MFNKDRLALLQKQFSNRSFFVLETINSTNNFAKTAKVIKHNPAVVLAFDQYAGVGQRASKWQSAPGKNLTFTIANKPPNSFNTQHYLLAIALAITSVLNKKLGLSTTIKWPNDILVKGKKLAGILVEAIFEGSFFKSLITGIGINVNEISFPDELKMIATSLKLELDITIDPLDLLTWLLEEIEQYSSEISKEEFAHIFRQVNEILAFKNEKVSIVINRQSKITATIIGIDDNGALWIRDEEENFRKFLNEQISITAIS
jgi:BirA family biotin operon repressor/biotin-[acetyl-CoA-carboxylase] ligase